ncbi:hypothetical protein HanPI659440_Chr13g0481351 [Helianthus annuus]|nr:hypothetical protein HanPI659440_Chr13g0481351 [Helianthus annuus]
MCSTGTMKKTTTDFSTKGLLVMAAVDGDTHLGGENFDRLLGWLKIFGKLC